MTTVKKLNTLVADVFSSEVADIDQLWLSSSDVQKRLKTLLNSKQSTESKKDPDAPKKGKSGYLYFCDAFRLEVKTSLGADSKATDITRELGKRWNLLKASTKASDKKLITGFEKAAADDKARYDKEKLDYIPPDGLQAKRRGGKKTNKEGPKRAKSTYLYFCDANRDEVKAKNPSLKATEVTSELGRLWNVLKEDKSRASELAKYNKMAEDDKSRYASEKSGGVTTKAVSPVVVTKAVVKPSSPKKKPPLVVEEELLEEEEVSKPKKNKPAASSAKVKSSKK